MKVTCSSHHPPRFSKVAWLTLVVDDRILPKLPDVNVRNEWRED